MKRQTTSNLQYRKLSKEEQQRRGILGRLVGVCADFISPTRNGRKYSEQLWEKVFADPIMKERIENGVCFGELCHPADRTETDIEKAAICLAEVPQKGPDGKLRAVFDILSTPNGKILKTLCDYGSTLGISSRGSGDIVTGYDGEEEVDPDTYDCQGFDIVLIPAVKEARLQYVTESLNKKKNNKTLRESLEKTYKEANDQEKKVMKESLEDIGIILEELEDTNSPMAVLNKYDLDESQFDSILYENDTEDIEDIEESHQKEQNRKNKIKELKSELNKINEAIKNGADPSSYDMEKENIINNLIALNDYSWSDVNEGKETEEFKTDKKGKKRLTELTEETDEDKRADDDFVRKNSGKPDVIAAYFKGKYGKKEEDLEGTETITTVTCDNCGNIVNKSEAVYKEDGIPTSGLEGEVWCKDCVNKNIIREEESKTHAVDNNEAVLKELEEALTKITELENKIMRLQEKLSVSYAKEVKNESIISNLRKSVAKLTESSNKVPALKRKATVLSENLNAVKKELSVKSDKIKKLEEENKKNLISKKSLTESYTKNENQIKLLNEELKKSNKYNEELESELDSIKKDSEIIKNECAQKVESANKKVEQLKTAANTAVNRYIESVAVKLGVSSREIKSRLPEKYTFEDIDAVCEDVQKYKLNVSKLPFSTATIKEDIQVKTTPSTNESIMPTNNRFDDDVDEQLMGLAKL